MKYHMVVSMGFYTTSHGKFHVRGYLRISSGINSIDIIYKMLHSRTFSNHNHMVIIILYYLYWGHSKQNRYLQLHSLLDYKQEYDNVAFEQILKKKIKSKPNKQQGKQSKIQIS